MTEHEERQQYRAEMLLLVVVVIWAANYPLVKWGISGLDIFVFNAVRFIVASLVLIGLFLARSAWKPVARSDVAKLIGAGFIANVLYQVIFIFGISLTTAGNS